MNLALSIFCVVLAGVSAGTIFYLVTTISDLRAELAKLRPRKGKAKR